MEPVAPKDDVMKRRLMTRVGFLWTMAGFSALASAQFPTLSLEVTELNGKPLLDGTRARVTAVPGDQMLVKILLRDWSPNGERLRSYQATLDPATFASGTAGKVQPAAFGEATPNPENAFIDGNDPIYIHKGLHTLPLAESSTPDYHWITVLFEGDQGPISKQDGKKFSCGSLRIKVSDDAAGSFTIKLYEDAETTMILDPNNERILPLRFEPLVVNVLPASGWVRINASDPPSGAIDARDHRKSKGSKPWYTVRLTGFVSAEGLSVGEFSVNDGTSNPPRIAKLTVDGSTANLLLDRPIQPGRWTTITHQGSATSVRINAKTGDVNNDGVFDAKDVLALIDALNKKMTLAAFQADVNNDGRVDGQDLARLINLLASSDEGR